jgi:hypothetical protein
LQQDAQLNERAMRDIQDKSEEHFTFLKGQHDDFEITVRN